MQSLLVESSTRSAEDRSIGFIGEYQEFFESLSSEQAEMMRLELLNLIREQRGRI
jgi:hypothetical protein